MTPDWMTEWVVGLCALGVAFVLGCWWGLWLAATRPARMERFATWAHRQQLALNELDYELREVKQC